MQQTSLQRHDLLRQLITTVLSQECEFSTLAFILGSWACWIAGVADGAELSSASGVSLPVPFQRFRTLPL